jgi:hypothetical protein
MRDVVIERANASDIDAIRARMLACMVRLRWMPHCGVWALQRRCFEELKRLVPRREGILFIKADNEVSLRAHRKMGMRQVAEFQHAGTDLVVFSYQGDNN